MTHLLGFDHNIVQPAKDDGASQSKRMSGTSAPQPRPLQVIVHRPSIGDGRYTVRVFWIKLRQFFFHLLFDLVAPVTNRYGKTINFDGERLTMDGVFGLRSIVHGHGDFYIPILRDIFEHLFVEQNSNRIQVTGKSVRANAQGFERDRAATCERVNDQRTWEIDDW